MSIFDIIVPVYNIQSYLPAALDSILSQSLSDIRVICVNDGSTDTSFSILEDYAQRDKRITLLNQSNRGAGAARNRALDIINAPYVAFVDADDIIHPEYLAIHYKALTDTGADFSWCRDKRFHDESEIREVHWEYHVEVFPHIFTHFVLRSEPHPSVMMNKAYKASLVQSIRFNENLRHVEDILFGHYMFYQAKSGVFINAPLYYYRQHGTSVSNVAFSPKYIDDHITVGEELARWFLGLNIDEETTRHFWFRTAKMMLKNPLVQPWRKNRKHAQEYWDRYRERLLLLYEEGLFRPHYLDYRNRLLAYALLTRRYWLIACILKLSYW